MELKEESFGDDSSSEKSNPNIYRVVDDNNLNQKDLERNAFVYDEDKNKPVMEGKAMGGENFGKTNETPTGDDKNNPSQSAGYSNPYFARTKPMEEHPENSNFKVQEQQGEPDNAKAQPISSQSQTIGNSDEVNIPGPIELPDQQKVGENNYGNREEKEHIET